MYKRIRYTKTGTPNVFRSVKSYQHPTDGSRYSIKLDLSSKTVEIINEVIQKTVHTISVEHDSPTGHLLKIKAREHLVSLGLEFQKEERGEPVTSQEVA